MAWVLFFSFVASDFLCSGVTHGVEIGKARRPVRVRAPLLPAREAWNRQEGATRCPPRRSGEGWPVGAFGTGERGVHQDGCCLARRSRDRDHKGLDTIAPYDTAAGPVARMAIHIDRTRGGQSLVIGRFTCVGGIGRRCRYTGSVQVGLVRISLMIMHMVPKVLRCLWCRLVPAIRRCGRPDGLERQKHQQENEKHATHRQQDSKQAAALAARHSPQQQRA